MTPTPIDRLEIPRAQYLNWDEGLRQRVDIWVAASIKAGLTVTRRWLPMAHVVFYESWAVEPPHDTSFRYIVVKGEVHAYIPWVDGPDPRDWRMVVADREYAAVIAERAS